MKRSKFLLLALCALVLFIFLGPCSSPSPPIEEEGKELNTSPSAEATTAMQAVIDVNHSDNFEVAVQWLEGGELLAEGIVNNFLTETNFSVEERSLSQRMRLLFAGDTRLHLQAGRLLQNETIITPHPFIRGNVYLGDNLIGTWEVIPTQEHLMEVRLIFADGEDTLLFTKREKLPPVEYPPVRNFPQRRE